MAMNLGYMLTRSAWSRPHHVAVIHGSRRQTYAELNDRVNRLAAALREAGLEKGDRVGILSPNCPEVLEALFAIWKAGMAAVPINFRLHPNEVRYIVGHSEASALLFDAEFADAVDRIAPQCPSLRQRVQYGPGRLANGARGYEAVLNAASPDEFVADVEGNDLAWLFYTSGTTGQPKGAMLSHRVVTLAVLNALADIYPFGPDDVALHASPLTHGSGFHALPVIAKGGTNVILDSPRFDGATVFSAIERHRVTVLPFMAPTMVKRLIDFEAVGRHDVSSLRCIVYGGAPMYVEDLIAGLRRFGQVFVQLYGQGECPMTITAMTRAEHDVDNPGRLASAGTARTGVQVRVVDEAGQELPRNRVGEISVRSDLVMTGYWRDPEATAGTVRNGWLRTGDLGYMDQQGYLFIMDRTKDMLISGGNNIYPREIEEVLLRHPSVSETCVFGVPDPEWGESVKAVVVLRPGHCPRADELVAFCREHLASYKKPKSIDFVSELPKNNYGKILKRELRAQYWGDGQRKV